MNAKIGRKSLSAVVALILLCGTFANTAHAQYVENDLVADVPGHATRVDPLLIDPWGMVLHNGKFIVANNGKDETPGAGGGGVTTFYNQAGNTVRLPVRVPAAPSFGNIPGTPTGVVYNPSNEFVISKNGKSAPAELIFDTLDGTISGWSPKVDPENAIIIIDNSSEEPIFASYTALAIARQPSGHYVLYAVDSGISPIISNNRVVMYDGNFNEIGHFGDPNAPSNMTAFGINLIGNQLYLTYAAFEFIQGGVVDIFDLQGNMLSQFASNGPEGPMEEPWGVALAPKNFGPLGGTILVGDVSDGITNAFDSQSGNSVGRLESSPGTPITLPGLWALLFSGNRLFFTAGPSFPPNSGPFGVFEDGLFGYIAAARH